MNYRNLFLIVLFTMSSMTWLTGQGENGVWLFGNGTGIQFNYPAIGDPFPTVIHNSHMSAAVDVATYSHIVNGVAQPYFSTDGVLSFDVDGNRVDKDIFTKIYANNVAGSVIIVVMPQHPERIYYASSHTYETDFSIRLPVGRTDLSIDPMLIIDGVPSRTRDINNGHSLYREINPTQSIVAAKGTCGNLWLIFRNTINLGQEEAYSDLFISMEVAVIPPAFDDDLRYFSGSANFLRYINYPVTMKVGLPNTSKEHSIGRMRMSQDNERLAKTALPGYIELFDFNRTTGKVTNPVTIAETADNPYGICFSPDDELFYSTESVELSPQQFATTIYQYDLTLGSTQDIISSKTAIVNFEGPTALVDMQITEHDQIFIGREGESFLSAITRPNERGTACAFEEIGIDLTPSTFSGPGLQNLIVLADDVVPAIDPNVLGRDTTLCAGETLDLRPKDGNIVCQWNDGTEVPSMQITEPGTYWVQVNQNNECVVRDTITIDFQDNPVPDLGRDTSICEGASVILDSGLAGVDISWQDGTGDPQQTVTTEGVYWVEAKANNCTVRDSIAVSYLPSILDIGNDTTICEGSSLTLTVDVPGAISTWQDGNVTNEYQVADSGAYHVIANTDGCEYRDTINVSAVPLPIFDLGMDSVVCEQRPIIISSPIAADSYLWQDGSTGTSINIDRADTYWLEVEQNGCVARDSIIFEQATEMCNCSAYIPNTFSPVAENENKNFLPFFSCEVDEYELQIFDRWGEEIYMSKNPELSWQGNFNAKQMPEGVYTYILKYRFTSDIIPRKTSGTISLLR